MIWSLSLSFGLGALGALGVSKYGHFFGLMDHPNHRSSHTRATPKGGGVGILIAFVYLSIVMDVSLFIWAPSSVLAILSFLGDRVDLSAKLRLIFQFSAAGVALLVLPPIIDKFGGGERSGLLGVVNHGVLYFGALIFVVGTANFYNFMDGINGIAGLTGGIAFGLLGIAGWQQGTSSELVMLPWGLSAACLGFLPFNFPKARVFMGDVSSILLGFVFGIFCLWSAGSWTDLVCYAGFLFPFYADEILTMVERVRDGDSLSKPHRRHLYQVLANEKKYPHWLVTLGYGLVQLFFGLALLSLRPYGFWALSFGWLVVTFGFFGLNRSVKRSVKVALPAG